MADLSTDAILTLLERALELKRFPNPEEKPLAGQTAGLVFQKPSLRTRVSFEVAMLELGGQAPQLHAACGKAAAEAGLDVVVGVRGNARHLAAAALNPDEQVASLLEATAAQARHRGGAAAAALAFTAGAARPVAVLVVVFGLLGSCGAALRVGSVLATFGGIATLVAVAIDGVEVTRPVGVCVIVPLSPRPRRPSCKSFGTSNAAPAPRSANTNSPTTRPVRDFFGAGGAAAVPRGVR